MTQQYVTETFQPKQVSATGNIAGGPARLGGVFVSAASATPTITVYDSATTGTATKIVDTFTPTAGTFYPMPFKADAGVYVVIAGTVSATFGVLLD